MIEQRQDLPVPAPQPAVAAEQASRFRALRGLPQTAQVGSGEPTTPARTGCCETLGAGRDEDMRARSIGLRAGHRRRFPR
jgi:hypothetical protein